MPVEILMPELGESVHEGTVSRWLKKEGDMVKEDEPVVEIMTDKVNTELPAPATGVLTKILIPEGEAVAVFAAMGIIDEDGQPGQVAEQPAEDTPSEKSEQVASTKPNGEAKPSQAPDEEAPLAPGEKRWYTPVVRSIAKEQGVSESELASIQGTGGGGRVTKKDLEAYLSGGRQGQQVVSTPPMAIGLETKPAPPTNAGPDQELTPLAGMRKMIAEHMVRSSQVPTVSTVTQVDVSSMVKFRELNKDAFQQQHGVKLTYTPFFIKALTESLLEFPLVNGSLTPDNQILTNRGVHIGVAVALGAKGDEGLIVPVIRDCHTKSLIEIAKDLEKIAKAARTGTLKPTDVQGGTFTLTNPGTYGALFGTPMINAPQAGILGTYAIQKMPVIVDDMIAVRSIMHLVLTYDHRVVDGLLAGRFLASVRDRLQNFDFFK
ncbi:MAG TPA: dihydrolipoamide acetyltransferase family protein [Fimbriimonadaceae bacterium]|nr:dihydrolipoamide acetyltransferase family protein [Fimbriimonadaceae bacterium]